MRIHLTVGACAEFAGGHGASSSHGESVDRPLSTGEAHRSPPIYLTGGISGPCIPRGPPSPRTW